MAKYSIILPVRNGGQYVKECVGSILSQKFNNFNFIVLDNASTDGTLEWLQLLNDERIKIIPSEKSLTIEENWGRIRDVEKNEFITLIGHDDILYPDFLAVIDCLINSNPEASLYHTHFNFIDAKSNIIRSCKPMNNDLSGYEFLKSFLTNSIDLMGTGYVMRSKDYDEIQGIPVKYPNLLFADFELWLNLTFKSYMATAPEKCFAFRIHQSTTTTSGDLKLHSALSFFINYLEIAMQKDENFKSVIKKYGSQFLLRYCKGYSHRLLRSDVPNRNGVTVNSFIESTRILAVKLGIQDDYHPEKVFSVGVAKIIDSSAILRNMFRVFKKVYSKPFL